MTKHANPSRPIIIWALLAAATIGALLLGTSHGASVNSAQAGTAAALAVGFVKVRYIGLEFMEIRTAHPALRWIFEGWVAVIGVALITLYLAG
jgi:hypothetical protein